MWVYLSVDIYKLRVCIYIYIYIVCVGLYIWICMYIPCVCIYIYIYCDVVCYREREGEVNSLTHLLFKSTGTKLPALCDLYSVERKDSRSIKLAWPDLVVKVGKVEWLVHRYLAFKENMKTRKEESENKKKKKKKKMKLKKIMKDDTNPFLLTFIFWVVEWFIVLFFYMLFWIVIVVTIIFLVKSV